MLVVLLLRLVIAWVFFFFQAEDGIRDLVRSRGLGDVYKRQEQRLGRLGTPERTPGREDVPHLAHHHIEDMQLDSCLLYTSDAADERSSVDLGGRRIIKKKQKTNDMRDVC